MTVYYEADGVMLIHADCRDYEPPMGCVDLTLADPPYGQTSLNWDRWPDGWLSSPCLGRSLWCFGSLRMFMQHGSEFAASGWRLSQDVIWEKQNGSSSAADR